MGYGPALSTEAALRSIDSRRRVPRRVLVPGRPTPVLLSALGLVLSLALPGCLGGLGPDTVRLTRTDYNVASQETSAQELLLNLVRLRYRDTPYFLQIASLSTNMRATAGVGGSGSFPTDGARVGGVDGSLRIEESPTITYTPLVGDRFVSELLEPVAPEVLLLLSHAGWSMDRFFRLLVQEINGVPNAPTASGPTPAREPIFDDFLRVAELFRILQSQRQVTLIGGRIGRDGAARDVGEEERGVLVRFSESALGTDVHRELAERLDLDPERRLFELVTGIGDRAPQRINLVLRSVMSAMFYASHAIEVPEADREAGRVTTTLDRDGEPFDWHRLTGSLLRVRAGRPDSRPYAAVRYRGTTFSIGDDDLESKSTFSMLNLILALQAGEVPSTGPVLTLPVSQ